jgi:hypothetical protein
VANHLVNKDLSALPQPSGSGSKPRARTTLIEIRDNNRSKSKKSLPLSPALRVQQAHELRLRLSPYIKGNLRLVITDNKSVIISVQRDLRHSTFLVRLHHLFVDAPSAILCTLARYIVFNDRSASRELNRYIDENNDRIRLRNLEHAHKTVIRTKGRIHDLKSVFDELNALYFHNGVRSRITWGRHVHRGKNRRSIKLGTYSLEENLIRIHPGLDQEWIPLFYIQWVVYHEMLHAIHPAPLIHGRHSFHTPAFTNDERRFVDYTLATSWEKRNVASLLCI